MTAFPLVSTAPLTRPVTRLSAPGNRRDVAPSAPTWEATICGVPQIFSRPLAGRPL